MRLTNEQRKDICNRYQAGESSVKLSKRYDVHYSTILNTLRNNGIYVRSAKEARISILNESDTKRACQLYTEGKSKAYIAQLFGVTRSTIRLLLLRNGFEKVHVMSGWEFFNENERNSICKIYTGGKSLQHVATKFKTSITTILSVLKYHKVKRRSCSDAARRYTINEKAFNVITEESAYWIGFLMADGCVSEGKNGDSDRILLMLQTLDIGHLKKFRSFVGSNRPIYSNKKAKASCATVVSNHLSRSLSKYGVIPRKCHVAKVIGLECNRHFWRGVVDGDGSVLIMKHRKRLMPLLQLTGNACLLEQFRNFILKLVPTFGGSVCKGGSASIIRISGSGGIKVIKELYDNSSIYLDLKYNVAHDIMDRSNDLAPGNLKGSDVYGSKLTEPLVKKIRHLYANCNLTYKRLGIDFGVSVSTIFAIVQRKTWNHI